MAYGFGVGKTVSKPKSSGNYNFGIKQEEEKKPTNVRLGDIFSNLTGSRVQEPTSKQENIADFFKTLPKGGMSIPDKLGGEKLGFEFKNPARGPITSADKALSRDISQKKKDELRGGSFDETNMEIDHIVPVSLGGTRADYNLQALSNDRLQQEGKVLVEWHNIERFNRGEITQGEAIYNILQWQWGNKEKRQNLEAAARAGMTVEDFSKQKDLASLFKNITKSPTTAGQTTPGIVEPERQYRAIGPESGIPVRGPKEGFTPLSSSPEIRIPFIGKAPEFLQPTTGGFIPEVVSYLTELPEKNLNDVKDYLTLLKEGRLKKQTPKEQYEQVPSHVREFEDRIEAGVNPVGASLLFFGETVLDWSIVGGEAKKLLKKALDIPINPQKTYQYTYDDLLQISRGPENAKAYYQTNAEKIAAYMKNKPKNISEILKNRQGISITGGKVETIGEKLAQVKKRYNFNARPKATQTAPTTEVTTKTPEELATRIKPVQNPNEVAQSYLHNVRENTYTPITNAEYSVLRNEIDVIPFNNTAVDEIHLTPRSVLERDISDAVQVPRDQFLSSSPAAQQAMQTTQETLAIIDRQSIRRTAVGEKPTPIKAETKTTKVSQIVKVPRSQLPVKPPFGKGEKQVSRLAARMKNNLKTLTEEQRSNLPEYNKIIKDKQLNSAAKYVTNNKEEALSVLKGEMDAPSGLLYNSIARAMFELADLTDDVGLALELTSLRASRFGQELSMLSGMDEMNSAVVLSKIKKDRVKALTKADKKTIEITKKTQKPKLDKALRKTAPKKDAWESFLEEIKC